MEILSNQLPIGDINIFVVTDVHSWVSGHALHYYEDNQSSFTKNDNNNDNDQQHDYTYYNVDYGHVLSFYQHIQHYINHHTSGGKDIFFVMNGDFMDGTGLSTIPPNHLIPILQYMPFNAINIGNHELYHTETIDYLKKPNGFIDYWNGTYLTSNTLYYDNNDNQWDHLGSPFTYMIGIINPNIRLLTFGFLYNFQNYCDKTYVKTVEDTMKEEWFINELLYGNYSNIVVLAHMDCTDSLVKKIKLAIRHIIKNETIPILFITGHTHRRAFSLLSSTNNNNNETNTASFEAGHFLDTIGYISFNISSTPSTSLSSDDDINHQFYQYKFIDANQDIFRSILSNTIGKLYDTMVSQNNNNFHTNDGIRLSTLIQQTRQQLKLNTIIGYIPQTYYMYQNIKSLDSLWRLYIEYVIPQTIYFVPHVLSTNDNIDNQSPAIFIQSTGSFRYDLIQGICTLDDIIAVTPFNDTIYTLTSSCKLPGELIQETFRLLNSNQYYNNSKLDKLPRFVSSCNNNNHYDYGSDNMKLGCVTEPNQLYDLYAPEYDIKLIVQVLEHVLSLKDHSNEINYQQLYNNKNCLPMPLCIDDDICWNTVNIWTSYVSNFWPYNNNNNNNSSIVTTPIEPFSTGEIMEMNLIQTLLPDKLFDQYSSYNSIMFVVALIVGIAFVTGVVIERITYHRYHRHSRHRSNHDNDHIHVKEDNTRYYSNERTWLFATNNIN